MEKEFNFNKYWGSSLIEPHVVFRRNSNMYCVYCGEEADTREHCPSKAFLQKPYPADLPTVPACKKCNNGFSYDERYASNVIKCLASYYEANDMSVFESEEKDLKEIKEARKATKEFVKQPFFDERLANVFRKLAICHASYEISTGYFSKDWDGTPERISYVIKPFVRQQDWENLEYAEVIHDEILPEIGARAFRNIYVVQAKMVSIETGTDALLPMIMVDWVDVQDGFYKYQVYLKDNKIWVKMIFRDLLYCEVVFSSNTN